MSRPISLSHTTLAVAAAEKPRANRTMRGRRSVSCERSGAWACSSASASSGRQGRLAARLETGVVLGQRLGEHAARHGGVLDGRHLGVEGPTALELGHDQAAVRPEPEHRDAVAARAGRRRQPVEVEGHDLHGRTEDGGVRQHPLLQIGALLEARFLERDHLSRHRDGSSHCEQHLFRHFSRQGRANGRFSAGTESHTECQRNIKTGGQTRVRRPGPRRRAPLCGV